MIYSKSSRRFNQVIIIIYIIINILLFNKTYPGVVFAVRACEVNHVEQGQDTRGFLDKIFQRVHGVLIGRNGTTNN